MVSDLARKFIAIVVLIVAAWILLKVVIGLVAGIAWIVVIVLAIGAILWAINTLG